MKRFKVVYKNNLLTSNLCLNFLHFFFSSTFFLCFLSLAFSFKLSNFHINILCVCLYCIVLNYMFELGCSAFCRLHRMMHRGLQNVVLSISKVAMMLLMIFQSSLKGKRRKEMPDKQNQSRSKLSESIPICKYGQSMTSTKAYILCKLHGHLL